MIIRLYTGEDGQAHFEDLNVPDGDTETVALKAGAEMTYRRFPNGSFSDWHNAPRIQYVIVLSGPIGCWTQGTYCRWKTLPDKATLPALWVSASRPACPCQVKAGWIGQPSASTRAIGLERWIPLRRVQD